MSNIYFLGKKERSYVEKLKGPVFVFGAGGFIGVNLLKSLLEIRADVYGISQSPSNNWRLSRLAIPKKNLIQLDINSADQLEKVIKKYNPQTIFNLAAYGAYSKQQDYKKIYTTNFNSTVTLLEILKKNKFSVYIQAGSQSEYGLNCAGPIESEELIPNSHYAVSKVADFYVLKYFGLVEKLPVMQLRLYSAYGPWEEPDRLMPMVISSGRNGDYPKLSDGELSRDFIYVKDIVNAFIIAAAKIKQRNFGKAYNIATGKKTKIKDLAKLIQNMFNIEKDPVFGTFQKKTWDLGDWFGNSSLFEKEFQWKAKTSLVDGIEENVQWQKEIEYDKLMASWNGGIR